MQHLPEGGRRSHACAVLGDNIFVAGGVRLDKKPSYANVHLKNSDLIYYFCWIILLLLLIRILPADLKM